MSLPRIIGRCHPERSEGLWGARERSLPVTSLLVAGRLIRRFGTAPVVTLGLAVFAAGCAWWAIAVTTTPSLVAALGGIILTGIGVGLTMPTLMGAAAGSLPAVQCV